MLYRAVTFVKDVAKYTFRKAINFVVGTVQHIETVTILSFSAIGLNTMIGEAPFVYSMPMWIESPMVVPVISVIIITLLLKSAEKRSVYA